MTTTTPDHDIARCHAASEDRRQLLCKLRNMAELLDDCDRVAMKAAGCGDLFNIGKKGGRYVNPDPADAPLITYPENPPRESYQFKPPKKRAPWELSSVKSQELIAGYVKNRCDCVRHNGLQDQCELTQCQGRPLCLTKPVPLCPPGGGADLLVTPREAAAIIGSIDENRCCRLSCCPGLMDNC